MDGRTSDRQSEFTESDVWELIRDWFLHQTLTVDYFTHHHHHHFFFNTIFVSSHMYPENPEGTQVIVGSMNMGYISDTVRNRTHNLFCSKRKSIPLGHSDSHLTSVTPTSRISTYKKSGIRTLHRKPSVTLPIWELSNLVNIRQLSIHGNLKQVFSGIIREGAVAHSPFWAEKIGHGHRKK